MHACSTFITIYLRDSRQEFEKVGVYLLILVTDEPFVL